MRSQRKRPFHRFTLLSHAATGRLRRRERPAQPRLTPEEARRQAEIEHELLLARDIQQGLLLEGQRAIWAATCTIFCRSVRDATGS
jgi:sigma-B regulation protein RsbU (phosphoserine phosphatase)